MIIQGSNKPLKLEFDEPIGDVSEISITIFDASGTLVLRSKSKDFTIDGSDIYVPLTQVQTSRFICGKARVLVKWKSNDGYIEFADEAYVDVVDRDDRGVML